MAAVFPVARLRARAAARPALAASVGVWCATFLGFLAIGASLPVLPRYVQGPIGAGDLAVGVVIGCFAFAAIVGRPIGGRLADARGRRPVVVVGLCVSAVAGAMYLLPLGVPGLIAARLVLGVGDGWLFTAGATWIVDLAPDERRGQAIGLFGLAIWGGLTVGPLAGEGLLALASYDAVWVFCAVMPLLGALVAWRVPEVHVAPAPRPAGVARPP
ncbi:MAG: major facilitator transporter, partial [Solirubrobacterales bacterium]|nr:major facilitator transporter [Solirubrobacterales bacterium]